MSGITFSGLSSKLQNNAARTKVLEIASGNIVNQAPNPDLEDEQKRWLIVGICLHSVVSPALRQYIPPVVRKLYNKLEQSHHIDTQTYSKYMMHYRPTNQELNYEAINNNRAIPKNKGKRDIQKYDYRVQSEVDLTKLFMITSMAHYTGFDDTCDSSALLGIIINIDSFPNLVKQVAEKVRKDVRNPWAHCDFSEWDMIKLQASFQLMHQLIMNLQLPKQDETAILGSLTNWLTNGIKFLEGNTLGLQLLNDLKTETSALGKYTQDVVAVTDEVFRDIHKAVMDIESALDKAKDRVQNLETNHEQIKCGMNDLQIEVKYVKEKTTGITTDQETVRKQLEDIQNATASFQVEMQATKKKVDNIEKNQENMESYISENKSDIETITKYLSESRPKDKIFFYTPNRIPTFVGREDELEQLEQEFGSRINDHHAEVLCGLGGIGKTTLSIEYSWKYLNFYSGGVFWMSAESNEALQDSLQRLAIDINAVGADRKETVHRTLRWISNIPERWLLVVDNVDMEEIRGTIKEVLLGPWKRNSKGHIIITSRREAIKVEEEFGIGLENCITLDALRMPGSVQFMISRTGRKDEENDKSLHSLVNELGGLPLALEQAAAHIKILKCTFKEYLEKFIRKRLTLLKPSKPPYEIPKERQAVRTTWQLNFEYIEKQSDDEGMGSAAVIVMEILAFLYADEIPVAVLNTGSPEVTAEDLLDSLQDSLGVKQTIEILTSFSLFQWSSSDTISINRLAQEVIRENIHDFEHKRKILQDAARMINKAFEKTHTIYEVLESKSRGRMSLQAWNKLALHASTLKEHIFKFTKTNPKFCSVCLNVETCNILQASAIYHSLYQRQGEALACQDQMLSILAALDISGRHYQNLTRIKIPILSRERVAIQGCIAAAFGSLSASKEEKTSIHLLDSETLRQKGNEYFKMKRYNESIQCYSEAISVRNEHMDPTILCNRSLAYLKMGDYEHALHDADKCIQLNPTAWKGYCWKAYAIAHLIRLGKLSKSWESVGLASAAVAGHLNGQCLLEYKMKIEYPVVRYTIVDSERQFGREITGLHNKTYTTLLLRRGCYKLSYKQIITKSVQIIGIDKDVEIHCQYVLVLIKPQTSWFRIDFNVEPQINIHFENICFPSGSEQVYVGEGVHVTFYRCKFSNGCKGCNDFPYCKGGVGCVNKDPNQCRLSGIRRQDKHTSRRPSGVNGYAGIAAGHSGNVFLESCTLDRCGGGGIVCEDEGTVITIKNSIIKNMIQMGVEARYGGRIQVENCLISDNQFHGVAVGPWGYATVRNCTIQDNKEEGIWCGQTHETDTIHNGKSAGGSVCEIKDNLICQNGMCGISLDGGTFAISGNKVFENWLWGISVKSRSTVYISNNDIFENKCGGLRIGRNYSSSVILDGNSVRDHTGPGLHILECNKSSFTSKESFLELQKGEDILDDEVTSYSIHPIVTSRNVFKDNNKGLQHPKQVHALVQTCCFCHNVSGNLKRCSKCRKASYCSKQCQRSHWTRHKYFCTLLHETYTIELELSETQTFEEVIGLSVGHKTISTPLTPELAAEQRKGEPPDKTGKKKFIVKIQSGAEYTRYDPEKEMHMYDQSRSFEILFRNPQIYHMVCECGVLGVTQFTTKKIYCWASFKSNGKKLCIYTENLLPLQKW